MRQLVEHRNTVLHGSVVIKHGVHPTVKARKDKIELTPNELSKLIGRIDSAIERLPPAYFDFMDAVYKARAAK